MKQLGQIETQGQDWDIKPGDIVRLLQPFRPERYGSQKYAFAIVAGVVAEEQQPGLDGVVVYLYEPYSSTIYLDQRGALALFSFDSDEVELDKAIGTPDSKSDQ